MTLRPRLLFGRKSVSVTLDLSVACALEAFQQERGCSRSAALEIALVEGLKAIGGAKVKADLARANPVQKPKSELMREYNERMRRILTPSADTPSKSPEPPVEVPGLLDVEI